MLKSFLLGAATALVAVVCALYAVLRIVTRVFEAERKRILGESAALQAKYERDRVAAQPPLPAVPQRNAAMQREVRLLTVCALLPLPRLPAQLPPSFFSTKRHNFLCFACVCVATGRS